jgi:DNA-binding transcriptional ArsR family regulator
MRAHNNVAAATGSHQQDSAGERYQVAADVLALLADPTRLRLLDVLADGEYDVSTLTAQVPASRSSVSQHLGRLRLAGLVQVRRDGRRMLYRIVSDHLSQLVGQGLGFADHTVRGIPHHRTNHHSTNSARKRTQTTSNRSR